MRHRLWWCGMLLSVAGTLRAQQPVDGVPIAPLPTDPAIAEAISHIDPARIHADIEKLVSFKTRNTLSSMSTDLPPGEGINAAADWIESEFKTISAACGGCLQVKRDEFTEPGSDAPNSRIKKPTKLVNIYAIQAGTSENRAAPWVLVTGHYDSRATNVLDADVGAPGANDDASGVAVSLESARALTRLKFPGTIVFVAVAGEEQGLNGSRHLAQLAQSEGWPLEAVLNNDIVGGDTTPGETMQDKDVVRVFSENVPATATPEQVKTMLGLGEENDSPSRELARQIAELAPSYFKPTFTRPTSAPGKPHSMMVSGPRPPFHPVLELRRDRYLRSGDHTSFNGVGFAAVRFTEWRENFNHQHQTVRTEDGIQYGDLIQFVDPAYTANVARLNAATLADAPSQPQRVRLLTSALDNNSELVWEPAAWAPAGTTYEVVWRATSDLLWTHSASAGTDTRIKLNVSKDDVLFGVRSVDAQGHRSLPVAPVPARQ
jgi:hypothetical protein